ncbi:hypothetical protein ASG25_15940 [Rhizobium sp. Leaf384]|uniref:substrate-binding periplasmic protein n=1 Tax=unclassified Rhizobium TaxID=2613769 RepID=UPI0007140754|nr:MULTISPECIES: transporter substrate-binding domain-containing protein [unclassified Rhizobium]KQS76901.1 hypothetical protein ASG25_15940 [Rhizobium sp. Leaf384]KQS78172.1 hypothetical protein ASG58_07155 [Rhizobium sp. Leaf383]
MQQTGPREARRATAVGTAALCALLAATPAAAQPAVAPETPETPKTLTFLTEEYPPFGFMKGQVISGSSVEQVRRILADVDLDYTLNIVPWARAFATAQSDPATCIFSTALLPERAATFKWVVPLNVDTMLLVGRTGGTALPRTIEDATGFTVAVHKGDLGERIALARGFKHLDSAPSVELSLKKLLAGRVDLALLTGKTFTELKGQGQPLEEILKVETTRSGIACNRAVPDETIAAMQKSLDRMIADGTQAEIEHRYSKRDN